MAFLQFLQLCEQKAISFALQGDELKVNGPRESLTPDVVAQLRAFKPQLIDWIRKSSTAARVDNAVALVKADRAARLPASFGQEALWLTHRVREVDTAYHFVRVLHLDGLLDVAALQASVDLIVERHEALRTGLAEHEGAVIQHVLPARPLAIPVTDLAHLDGSEQQRQADAVREAVASQPFDLERDTLMRLALVRLGARRHQLVFVLHHIASDGWSLGVLVHELQSFYNAFAAGATPAPAPLPAQYADFAWSQRAAAEQPAWDESMQYWARRLAGVPELQALPCDFARPPVQSLDVGRVHSTIGAESTARLKALAGNGGATPFMALESLFAALVAVLGQQQDVVIMTPVANRAHEELYGLIGYFVNPVVLRHQVDLALPFSALLGRVKEDVLGAFAHQHIPYDTLVRTHVTSRSLSYSPLAQIVFAFQNNELPDVKLSGLAVRVEEPETGKSTFDLQLEVVEQGGGLALCWEYATDLFEPATIERMAAYFERLLCAAIEHPDLPVGALSLLTESERRQVLVEWNASAAPYPDRESIQGVFEEQVRLRPDAVAVRLGDAHLTYAQLNARANQLARYLVRERGVGPDTLVGMCLERSLDLAVAMLGILKAGGAYLPLEASNPRARLAYMLEDGAVATIVTHGALLEQIPHATGQALCLDGPALAWQLAQESPDNLEGAAPPDSLAYVIYTSGSTGQPKGVLVEHRGVVSLVSAPNYVTLSQDTVMLQMATVAFDAATFEFWGALLNGGELVLYPSSVIELDELGRLIDAHGVNTAWMTSGLFDQFASLFQHPLPSLRWLLVGGDVVNKQSVALMQRRNPSLALVNGYGPTENTTFSVCFPMSGVDLERRRTIPIGRPLQNRVAYVLDQGLGLCPPGVIGELYVGGAGVARGYLNRPDLSAERFIANPFPQQAGGAPASRLYRTGDLARWLADGTLEFLGRIDNQVKLRGFRIELGEIETRVASLAGVAAAVVLVRTGDAGDKRLVGYVVPSDGTTLTAQSLREALAADLADYMIPSAFVIMDSLPLTANGKVDRKALPEPDLASQQQEYVAPRNALEATLCEMWQAVLGMERVGITDNFFERGGHSLLAVTLIERMRQADLRVDVRVLFAMPTIADLAAAIDQNVAEVSVPPNGISDGCEAITPDMLPLIALTQEDIDRIATEVPGGMRNIQDIYPLAPLQQGILFHHLMHDTGDAYLLRSTLAFDSRQRLDDFVAALQVAIDRHDALRTGIAWEGLDEPVQVVWREATLMVDEVTIASGDVEAELRERFDPRHYRIDLREAPLMRCFVAHDAKNHRWLLQLLNHHMVSDHTTLDVLVAEIRMTLQGQSLPAALPFRNYVAQSLLGVSQEEHETFFRAMLGDVEEPTAPFGLRDTLGDGAGVDEATLHVEAELAARLREQARRLGVSAAALMHLAWARVLGVASGREDVVFGTVLFGRMQGGSGADRAVGLFINTLPIRIDVGSHSILHGVKATHAHLTALMRHEHAPLALAQHCSAVPASTPLFSSLLNYRHGIAADAQIPAAQVWEGVTLLGAEERTNYPFNLTVDDTGSGFVLTAQVSGVVDPKRVCGYVHATLAQLADALEAASDTRVCDLEVLPPDERRQVLVEWNATAAPYPAEASIQGVFEEQVRLRPDAVAVRLGETHLTYAQLNKRANQLARYLVRECGVGPDKLVGMCLERSLDMAVAMLAILKAGGAYLPLEASNPRARLAYMLDDGAVATIVTHGALLEQIPHATCQALCLDDPALAGQLAQESPDNLAYAVSADSLAYVIYTSGSTGQPKGVLVEHRGVVSLVSAPNYVTLSPDTVMLQMATVAFDAATFEFWGALLNGGELVMYPASVIELDELGRLIDAHGVDTAWMTSGLFDQFASLFDRPLPSLRWLLVGGDVVNKQSVALMQRRNPGLTLVNGYGPTENTTFSVCFPMSGVDLEQRRTIPIGRPLQNRVAYVLDAGLGVCPPGAIGELYVGGAGVARGYLNRPDLSAERFIVNPFARQAAGARAERLYRTGDLARWLDDGTLEFLGRIDNQVKLRGFRIELGEIESQVATLAGVAAAAVTMRVDHAGDKRLVGYVVPVEGTTLASQSLREALAVDLVDYMIPSAFVIMDSLPLTRNGKVDRKALPEPEFAGQQQGYAAPRSETERALCEIWQAVLGVPRVGVTDNFFTLGGHSLSATRVVAQIRARLKLDLPLKTLFTAPDLQALAAELARLSPAGAAPALVPVARDGALVASFAQQRLWLLDQIDGGNAHYNIPAALHLKGSLDTAALDLALGAIVARHESLRTCFVADQDGEPLQIIVPPAPFVTPTVDLSDLASGERAARVNVLVAEDAARSFDLARDLMLRAQLIRLGPDEHVLIVTCHHIASDGWSMAILVNELVALYGAFREGRANPLAPLAIQYADYAKWQRDWLRGDVLEAQLDYWTRQLARLPVVHSLPLDYARPAVQTFNGATHVAHVGKARVDALAALCQQRGATLFMGLHAAFSALLARYSNETDIVVGTPVANREQAEVAGLVGFFVNTLVLRSDLSGEPTFAALIDQSRAMLLDAYAHQQVPFEQIVDRLQPARSMSHSALFQVMLVYQNNDQGTLSLPDLTLTPLAPASTSAKYELTLDVSDKDGGLEFAWHYNTDLFEPATIERMAGHFGKLLGALVAQADVPVAALPLLTEAERARQLVEWNATQADYPNDQCIHALFEAQAAATPDATAVEYEGKSLSYRELDEQANRVAHYLIERGVRPDGLVALCAERSLDMIVGVLAVLKAGGAYVPLDPALPDERLAYMLADSGPALLLTQHRLVEKLAGLVAEGVEVVCLDSAAFDERSAARPVSSVSPSNLAYVIYTSGSTGQPKGVAIEHRSALNLLTGLVTQVYRDVEDFSGLRVSLNAPLAFDASVQQWLMLTRGATLCVLPEAVRRDGERMVDAIASLRLDALDITPSHLVLLLATDGARLPRYLLVGGESISQPLWTALQQAEGTRSFSVYGPTETTVDCIACDIKASGPRPVLGRPMANVRIHILDERLQPAPVGVVGEIHIGGPGLARGYLNRPELTAERFVRDPFSADGARLYKSGDLARYLLDGTIEYIGRNDFQVKLRGYRIELGEIETRLANLPGVGAAVVLARADHAGDQRLVGYVVPSDGATLDVSSLRAGLAVDLADYMIPSAFVILDSLPLTGNGKVDRKALPEPDLAGLQQEYVAPRNALEATLCEIWQTVLGVERVGVTDNFFVLGGHSLLAVTLIERMRQAGLPVNVRALFATPTIADLAAAIDGDAGERVGEVAVPPNGIPDGCEAITPDMLPLVALNQDDLDRIAASVPGGMRNIQDIYPLAPLQQGILFHHLMHDRGDAYLLCSTLAFDSRQRLDVFVAALQAAVDRHDALRTGIAWEGLDEPVQVVWREAQFAVEEVTIDASDVEAELRERFDPRHYRIDVREAPLMRGFVARDEKNDRWLLQLLNHHLVSDHTTLDVLVAEIRMTLQGQSLPAALPFRNYVAQALLGIGQEEHEAYFRAMLGDVEEPTAPFGLSDTLGDGGSVDEATLPVEPALAARLREQARRLGVSAAALMHLAWARVLGVASGREDVVFGTVLVGRMQGGSGADRAVGLFINTLPIRLDVGSQSVLHGVKATHARLADLLRHEHAPLALAQRCSAIAASTPLFSSLFNYRHGVAPDTQDAVAQVLEGVTLLGAEERTNYPINLAVDDSGSGFALTVQVSGAVDPARVCAYMHTALAHLVAALDAAPDTLLRDLDVLPQDERQRQLVAWNATQADYPLEQCIHTLFEAQAAATPDVTAVEFEGATLSYRELDEQANRVAHYLIEQGVRPDSLVAICTERSLAMIVGLFGVLKAGGAYVPLDPSYPRDRLAYMLSDSRPTLVLGHGPTLPLLRGLDAPCPIVDLEAADGAWRTMPARAPDRAHIGLQPSHLAYVIYTSGSTGQPKGAMNEHRGVVNRLLWMQDAYRLGAQDRVLQKTPFSFDVSVWELFWPLMCGARLCIARPEGHKDPTYLGAVARECAITTMHFVPSMLQLFLEHVDVSSCASLARVVCSGEALPASLARRFHALLPHVELHNLYGPTEAAVDVTAWQCVAGDERPSIPIGRPIANTRVYILDRHMRPVPVGVSGELYLGGVQVGRGYLNRLALTAERFVPDPFDSNPSARLYKTGDLARYDAHGNIEYLGRNDFQVKIRGLRIELGEIEAKLATIDGVREAAVLAREDGAGDKRLVAYLVWKPGEEKDVATIRGILANQLADFMIPNAFVNLDALPLNSNGKLDRKALPEPEFAGEQQEYVAPRSALEATLCEIWQDVLGVERVGVTDNFFVLGGHSLSATRVVAQIRARLKLDVPLKSLFATPDLQALAAELARLSPAGTAPALVPVARDGALVASFAQQRLWLLDQIDGGNAHYNMPAALHLKGNVDTAALDAALGAIVARHESLRTCFVAGADGEPLQIVLPPAPFVTPVVDLSDLPSGERTSRVDMLMADDAARSFDLARDLMLRTQLIKLAADEHILIVTCHHIASDGWSMAILVNEIGALYGAFKDGFANPLAPLAIQYADYAHWQRGWLRGDVLESQLGYWTRQLAQLPVVHSLPLDYARPAVQTFSGATHVAHVGKERTAALAALCRQRGATLFMGLHAAFSALLARYSNETDIVVGTPVANREQAEVAGLIGFFVNTLVLRSDLSGEPTFADLVDQSRATLLDAYAHQQVPFEQIVDRLQPARSMSHGALFQVMLVYQNNDQGTLSLPGMTLTPLAPANTSAKYDLTLDVSDQDGGLALLWEYNTDLFEPATIERMAGHFGKLLGALVAQADVPVAALPLLTEAERQRQVIEWNATQADYPREQCIHALFEAQAAATPDTTAVEYEGKSLSYRELDERANRVAHYLIERGVRPDGLVALCAERSLDMIVGVLAVLKAGGAYVPLDPALPDERLAYMLADSGPALVLTQHHLADKLTGLVAEGVEIVSLDSDAFDEHSAARPVSSVSPSNLAYVIYTSGSTGQPKGVAIEHRSALNLLTGLAAQVYRDVDDFTGLRVSLNAPLAFDASVQQWLMLTRGATLCVLPESVRRDVQQLADAIATSRLDVLDITPSHLALLLAAGARLPRYLLVGGEAIPQPLWTALQQAEGTRSFSVYGPTETTVDCIACDIKASGPRPVIGRPMANVRIHILDQRLQPAPVGVVGEIHIGGPGLARGYLNRPELTAERFVRDPFSADAGERLYKTGDLARYLLDGTIEYIGRNDFQVKLRGYRIELGEIETRLANLPGVSAAVVLARADHAGDQRLVGYVVPSDGATPTALALREGLAVDLADYMIPSAFVILDSLPLTGNGKVDRKALPEPEFAGERQEYVAPRSALEATLCEIWQDVLGVERVGVTDNFFVLGGHSLSATRVVAQIRARLKLDVPLKALFATPDLQALAAELARLSPAGAAPALVPVARDGALVASFAQQRLWLLDQIDGGNAHYNMPAALHLKGSLDTAALDAALGAIVARHESLRTCFVAGADGEPLQIVLPPAPFVTPTVDLSDLPSGERTSRVDMLMADDAARSFDLARDLMLRAQLIKLAADEHILIVTCHHIASDGWSMAILVNEIGALYGAFKDGRANPLTPLAIQYADYAHWQRGWLRGDVLEAQLGYWTRQLAQLPVVHSLPLDYARPAVQTFSGATHVAHVGKTCVDALAALCRQRGATLFMGLHAAFSALLARYSNETDIVVGTPVANREQAEVAGLIGFFVNTLVLRSDLSGEPTFAALIDQSRAMLLDAYAHQQVPFEQIVDRLQPARSMSHGALFQVMLVYQNNDQGTLSLPDMTLTPLAPANTSAKYDLTLNVSDQDGGLALLWEYNTDLFEPATIERMAGHFGKLLGALVAQADVPVAALPLLTEDERQRQLIEWNATQADYPREQCIHALFEAQVAATPNATAVEYEGKSLSYRELDERANRVAHYLLEQGVRPDSLVALCAERSLDMIVGVLAVLKAGGAYVPLDPALPDERLAYMLADSAPGLVLTQLHLADKLADLVADGVEIVSLDIDAFDERSAARPVSPVSSSNLAYVIYTSGSTGQPKGVAIEHRSALNLLTGLVTQVYRDVEDFSGLRVSLNAPLAFDASVQQWLMLTRGATLCVLPEAVRRDVQQLADAITTSRLDVLDITPSHLALLLATGARLPRYLLVGGEAIPQPLWTALQQAEGTRSFSVYGPTETTVDCIACDIKASGLRPVIGRPMANVRIHILDQRLQPAPVGVVGEIHIGGPGLARGYLNRPELTAERFVRDPFSADANERLYKTGDLARYLADGTIEYIGRNDFQVKLRGYRIELGEIETRLANLPGVSAAVVLARADHAGDQRLVGYVVPNDGVTLSVPSLREGLAVDLAEYMIPSAFVILDSLPLTGNGKVDRKALPEPEFTGEQQEYVAPRSALEATLCEIWQDVLGVERVGVADDFFRIGGNSLKAVKFVAAAGKAGLSYAVATVMRYPTIAELAPRQGGAGREAEQGAIVGEVPLSTAQQFFLNTTLDQPNWGNGHQYFDTPVLDLALFRQAFLQVLEHHDALRATFTFENGAWVQRIAAPDSVDITVEHADLSMLDYTAQVAHVKARMLASFGELDLARAPVIEVKTFYLGEQRGWSGRINVHHLLSDGYSSGIIFDDTMRCYAALAAGQKLVLPPKTASTRMWIGALTDYVNSPAMAPEIAYWRALPWHDVATIRVDRQGDNFVGSNVDMGLVLPAAQTRALARLGNTHGIPMMDVLIAALVQTLSDHADGTWLPFRVNDSGRTFDLGLDVSRTVGWLCVQRVLLLSACAQGNALDAVRHVHEQIRQIPGKGLGLELLQCYHQDDALRAELKALPPTELFLNFHDTDIDAPEVAEVAEVERKFSDNLHSGTNSWIAPRNVNNEKFTCNAFVQSGQLHITWRYSQNLFTGVRMLELTDALMANLAAIADCVDNPSPLDASASANRIGNLG